MMALTELRQKIESREAILGVIGLGYVGLPAACKFAEAGFQVIGVEIKADRVSLINAGRSPIEGSEPGLPELLAWVTSSGRLRATTEFGKLRDVDVALIDVETPVDRDHKPHFEALKAACISLGKVLKEGALVIVESTVAPGTMDHIVKTLLKDVTGRQADCGFYLGHCPERVMPGKLLANLQNVSRVCGGGTPETAETMVALYRAIVQADLDVSDCLTAELVKTTENAYRDVNIAFANEVALICEAVGGNVWKVRELVNKSPGRNMLLPGAGVGGHCIPKDPWLLAHSVEGNMPLRLITAARMVNDDMPFHMVDLTVQALQSLGCQIAGSRVAVLGYAYLEGSDDIRNSPSKALIVRLHELGADVVIHDPCVPEYQSDVMKVARDCHAAIVMVGHAEYRNLDLEGLKSSMQLPILIDGRHVFDSNYVRMNGAVYRGIGQSIDG